MGKEQELRPCPFCSRRLIMKDPVLRKWVHPLETQADVDCAGSAIEVSDNPVRIAAWNRRSSDEQAEVVGWPIDTEDQVEALAKECGWNNRRYMTPKDYAIWCSQMRQFAKLASPPAVAMTDQAVEAACKAFYGEAAWQFPRGIISKPSSIIAMRRALTAALAVGDEGIRPDLLAEMAKHPGWSIERGYKDRGGDEDDPYGWCVHEVRGGRNDREWDLIGFGETPHEALSAAVTALPNPPSRGEGE